VLFGTILVLLRKVVRSKPYDAGTWLTLASNRRELSFTLLSGLYAYIFGTITGSPVISSCIALSRTAGRCGSYTPAWPSLSSRSGSATNPSPPPIYLVCRA